jgi:hypothetical protein
VQWGKWLGVGSPLPLSPSPSVLPTEGGTSGLLNLGYEKTACQPGTLVIDYLCGNPTYIVLSHYGFGLFPINHLNQDSSSPSCYVPSENFYP